MSLALSQDKWNPLSKRRLLTCHCLSVSSVSLTDLGPGPSSVVPSLTASSVLTTLGVKSKPFGYPGPGDGVSDTELRASTMGSNKGPFSWFYLNHIHGAFSES